MDEKYGAPSSGTGRMKEQISEKVETVKAKVSDFGRETANKVSDFGRETVNKIDSSRESAANALDSTADSLQAGSNRLSGAARKAADSVQATADYVRRTNLQGMAQDVEGLVKRYPGQALAAAAILGFLVARGFRTSSND
jgi:ElaB/YqjD/DUF883 family membrane-anchored ribosome-binding protein